MKKNNNKKIKTNSCGFFDRTPRPTPQPPRCASAFGKKGNEKKSQDVVRVGMTQAVRLATQRQGDVDLMQVITLEGGKRRKGGSRRLHRPSRHFSRRTSVLQLAAVTQTAERDKLGENG